MSFNDILSDTVTRIRNGQSAKLSEVAVRHSKQNLAFLDILKSEGYITAFEAAEDKKHILVQLSYSEGKPVIREIKRVSKPGRRIYSKAKDIKNYFNGLGIAVISSSQGLMTNYKARDLNLGGEILVTIF